MFNRFEPAFLAMLRQSGTCSRAEALDCYRAFAALDGLPKLLHTASSGQGEAGMRRLILLELQRFIRSEKRCKPCLTALEAAGKTEKGPGAEGLGGAVQLFDIIWAQQVVTEALIRMKLQCRNENSMEVWSMFDERLCSPILAGKSPTPYQLLVERLGLKSPAHAHRVLASGKRMFSDNLTAVISEYECGEIRIQNEKAELHSILARA